MRLHKEIPIILATAFIFSACTLKVNGTSSTTTVVTEATPTPRPTFVEAMSGIWRADLCMPINGTGLSIGMNFSSGNYSQVYLVFPNDLTCSGNPGVINSSTGALVDAWPTAVAASIPTVSDLPDNFFITGGGASYGAIYKTSSTHAQYLVDSETSNLGATWAAWLSGGVDMAGFFADPINFVGLGVNSFNIPLNKVSSVFSATAAPTLTNLAGIWSTTCYDPGGSTGRKSYFGFLANGDVTYFEVNWPDTTCTGMIGSVGSVNSTTGSTIGAPVSNGSYEFNFGSAYSLIQKSGDYLFTGKSAIGTDDASSAPNRHTQINADAGFFALTAPTSSTLIGTWGTPCLDNGDGTSQILTIVFSHTSTYNFSMVNQHWNSDQFCTGGADVTDAPVTGTYAIGPNYKSGYEYDVHIAGGGDQYMTAFIVGTGAGSVMYNGIIPDGANDGSAPNLRISTVSPGFYYVKQ